MSNRKNLANGILALGVSTSDTTWDLESGYGDEMPAVPFDLTVTPFGQLSTMGNSEIVLVTARTGDTLTVTRAQKGTTAKSFSAGSIVSNGVYVEDMSNIVEATATGDAFPLTKNIVTASGDYIPVKNDILEVIFPPGTTTIFTSFILDGNAYDIRKAGSGISSTDLPVSAGGRLRFYFDGSEWNIYGIMDKALPTEISENDIDVGTSGVIRTISGRRARYIIDKALSEISFPVNSVAGKTGAVTLVKGDVGLGNVDNTSDMDKPISTATIAALSGKQDTLSEISQAEVDDGTASTARYITGRRAKYIIDKAVAAIQALTNWVTTAMLQNNAVTTAKVANSSITASKLYLPDFNIDPSRLSIQILSFSSSSAFAAYGNVWYRDISGQSWPTPFTTLYGVYITSTSTNVVNRQCWYGGVYASTTGTGTIREYRPASGSDATQFNVIGIGII